MRLKPFALFSIAAALAANVAVGSALAQTTTQWTTVTTDPYSPTVTSKTVTTRTVVNQPGVVVSPPPAVIVNPPPVVEEEDESPVLGTAVSGNTTIVFKAADDRDIRMMRLRTWDDFAEEHPRIAGTLAYKPWLINDPVYLSKHPSLNAFFLAHPEIKVAMAQNTGNFTAIPPRPGE